MAKKKMNIMQIILGILFTAAGLTYLALGADLVPDASMTVVGFMDDAVVMFVLWILFKRAQKKMGIKG